MPRQAAVVAVDMPAVGHRRRLGLSLSVSQPASLPWLLRPGGQVWHQGAQGTAMQEFSMAQGEPHGRAGVGGSR